MLGFFFDFVLRWFVFFVDIFPFSSSRLKKSIGASDFCVFGIGGDFL